MQTSQQEIASLLKIRCTTFTTAAVVVDSSNSKSALESCSHTKVATIRCTWVLALHHRLVLSVVSSSSILLRDRKQLIMLELCINPDSHWDFPTKMLQWWWIVEEEVVIQIIPNFSGLLTYCQMKFEFPRKGTSGHNFSTSFQFFRVDIGTAKLWVEAKRMRDSNLWLKWLKREHPINFSTTSARLSPLTCLATLLMIFMCWSQLFL